MADAEPTTPSEDLVRIVFRLERDEDGYPPYDTERLWAKRLGSDTFEIDNIPVFARDVSLGDHVSAIDEEGQLTFRSVIARGGHSTVRVVTPADADGHLLLRSFVDLGCTARESRINGFYTIDVPPSVSLSTVERLLEDGERKGLWDYEESAIGHPISGG
jgi:hypothetical protein